MALKNEQTQSVNHDGFFSAVCESRISNIFSGTFFDLIVSSSNNIEACMHHTNAHKWNSKHIDGEKLLNVDTFQ